MKTVTKPTDIWLGQTIIALNTDYRDRHDCTAAYDSRI